MKEALCLLQEQFLKHSLFPELLISELLFFWDIILFSNFLNTELKEY